MFEFINTRAAGWLLFFISRGLNQNFNSCKEHQYPKKLLKPPKKFPYLSSIFDVPVLCAGGSSCC
jgi:hypothetical protein